MSLDDAGALYRLMAWLSPAYPTGGFSYSHGLEYAVEAGLVTDPATLTGWVAFVLSDGAARSDAILLAAAWRAVAAADGVALDTVRDLAGALRGSAELALESAAQGSAFLSVTRAAWPHPALDRLADPADEPVALPVAVGAAAAAHGLPLAPVLAASLQSAAANLVSAGVRLIPLGQVQAQRAIARLEPAVRAAARAAAGAGLDEIGSAAPMVDWTSMRHETQYTRLFRS